MDTVWSGANIVAIITAIGVAVAAVVTAWRTGKTIEKIHVLVNSGKTANLRALATQARRIALLTTGEPGHDQDVRDLKAAEADLLAAERATDAAESK